MNLELLKWNKPLALPPQLKWQFAHEPELLGWTIRARNYNTFVANCMLAFMLTLISVVAYLVYLPPSQGKNPLPGMIAHISFYSLIALPILCTTHQKMNFAYRFTQSGVECCEWKNFPEWALTFMKWLIGITSITFIFLTTLDITFLIGGLIGTGSLALTYRSMAGKHYRDMHTQYYHLFYEWKDLTQLTIATNREVVDFNFTHFNKRFARVISWNQNIFCKRKKKEEIFNFIKRYIPPEIPCIKTKVNVPYGTD